ncbi:hypothetical protein E2320_005501 [Naja naja]|nr:hypothetical protein E2320_005501 [Naja naja]
MAQIGTAPSVPVEPLDPQGPDNTVFSEPTVTWEDIPCPKLFLNVIQRQWGQPGTFPNPGGGGMIGGLSLPTSLLPFVMALPIVGGCQNKVISFHSVQRYLLLWGALNPC